MLMIIALVLLIVFLCVAISMMSSSSKTSKLTREKLKIENEQRYRDQHQKQTSSDREFNENWEVMARFDSNVREQIERLESYGAGALDELKRAYKVTRDKDRIPDITSQIITDIESGKSYLSTAEKSLAIDGANSSEALLRGDPISKKIDGLAIVTLVLGVLGLVVSIISPCAVVLGHVTLRKLDDDVENKSSRTMTIVGLLLGYLGLLFLSTLLILWFYPDLVMDFAMFFRG